MPKTKTAAKAKKPAAKAKPVTKASAMNGEASLTELGLSKMATPELKVLVSQVETELGVRRKAELAEVAMKMRAIAAEVGMTLEDFVGKGKKSSKAKGIPKYANPDDSEQTWTGRGKRPAWMHAAIAAGKALEDMAISHH